MRLLDFLKTIGFFNHYMKLEILCSDQHRISSSKLNLKRSAQCVASKNGNGHLWNIQVIFSLLSVLLLALGSSDAASIRNYVEKANDSDSVNGITSSFDSLSDGYRRLNQISRQIHQAEQKPTNPATIVNDAITKISEVKDITRRQLNGVKNIQHQVQNNDKSALGSSLKAMIGNSQDVSYHIEQAKDIDPDFDVSTGDLNLAHIQDFDPAQIDDFDHETTAGKELTEMFQSSIFKQTKDIEELLDFLDVGIVNLSRHMTETNEGTYGFDPDSEDDYTTLDFHDQDHVLTNKNSRWKNSFNESMLRKIVKNTRGGNQFKAPYIIIKHSMLGHAARKHRIRRRLEDNHGCPLKCYAEDENFWECQCKRLIDYSTRLTPYDLAILFAHKYIETDPDNEKYASFKVESLSSLNLFDVNGKLSDKANGIRSKAAEMSSGVINEGMCDSLLEEFHTAIQLNESKQLSVDDVEPYLNTYVKLEVSEIAKKYDNFAEIADQFEDDGLQKNIEEWFTSESGKESRRQRCALNVTGDKCVPPGVHQSIGISNLYMGECCSNTEPKVVAGGTWTKSSQICPWHFQPNGVDSPLCKERTYPDVEAVCAGFGGRVCSEEEYAGRCVGDGGGNICPTVHNFKWSSSKPPLPGSCAGYTDAHYSQSDCDLVMKMELTRYDTEWRAKGALPRQFSSAFCEGFFDPSSTSTNYIDDGTCSPRGDDAREDMSHCPHGHYKVCGFDGRWDNGVFVNGCKYWYFEIFECKTEQQKNPIQCNPVSYTSCAEFADSFDHLYQGRNKVTFPDENPMRRNSGDDIHPSIGYNALARVKFPVNNIFDNSSPNGVKVMTGFNYTSGLDDFPGYVQIPKYKSWTLQREKNWLYCKGGSCDPTLAPNEEKHPFLCCAHDAYNSASKCKFHDCSAKSHKEADEYCKSVRRRLCTGDEIENECGVSNEAECDHSSKQIWSAYTFDYIHDTGCVSSQTDGSYETAMEICDATISNLVGRKTSIGTVTRIAGLVNEEGDGADFMPGKCCLDTPTTSTYFGETYNPQQMKCQNPGWWHLGISPESCSGAGGQWTLSPCLTLKKCIDERPSLGKTSFNKEFEDWVKGTPDIVTTRKVRIYHKQSAIALSLKEVQIIERSGIEISFNKTVAQKSTDGLFGPEKAVNGDMDDCASTTLQDNPWWEVDLGLDAHVIEIIIHSDSDSIYNAFVSLLDEGGQVVGEYQITDTLPELDSPVIRIKEREFSYPSVSHTGGFIIYDASDKQMCENARVELGYERDYLDDTEVCNTFKAAMCDEESLFSIINDVTGDNVDYRTTTSVKYNPKKLPDGDELPFDNLEDFKKVLNGEGDVSEKYTQSSMFSGSIEVLTHLVSVSDMVNGMTDVGIEVFEKKWETACRSQPPFIRQSCWLAFLVGWLVNGIQKYSALLTYHVASTALQALSLRAPDFAELLYYYTYAKDKWLIESLGTINVNIGTQHKAMKNQLEERQGVIMNEVNTFNNCRTELLQYEIQFLLNKPPRGGYDNARAALLGQNPICKCMLWPMTPGCESTDMGQNSLEIEFPEVHALDDLFPNQDRLSVMDAFLEIENKDDRMMKMLDGIGGAVSDVLKELDMSHGHNGMKNPKKSKKAKHQKQTVVEVAAGVEDNNDRKLVDTSFPSEKITMILEAVKSMEANMKAMEAEMKEMKAIMNKSLEQNYDLMGGKDVSSDELFINKD